MGRLCMQPFRGGVTLIPVDVSVLERDGKPVAGLKAGDFEVKLDGRAQPVRVVNYEEVTTVANLFANSNLRALAAK